MSDDSKGGAAIPAWQRSQKPLQVEGKNEMRPENTPSSSATAESEPKEVPIPSPEPEAEDSATSTEESVPTDAQLRENVKSFLQDPAVKDAPMEKKRAFFESKGIPKDMVEEVLKAEEAGFTASDFEGFKQQQQQQGPPEIKTPPPRPQQQQASGPPIIMYPEHLEEAHKPPPLITPSRLVNTAYFVGGLAALIYGASKYLVTPMSASLTEARHDFAAHSQGKVDEMNLRLEKLVSKVPAGAKTITAADENAAGEDDDSETSDPTELYHRDMGTQTSPAQSRRSSSSSDSISKPTKKDPIAYQSNGLSILSSHLNEMLNASNKVESANKERQDSLNKLRHNVDGMLYGSMAGLNVWNQTEDAAKKREKEAQDAMEDLKKEIRGVKGVLLSAKRFPGPGGQAQKTGA